VTPVYMRNIALLLPIVVGISPLGRATVVYSLVAGSSIQFQYTSPGFITTTTAVLAANLDSCMFQFGSCGEVDFFPVSGSSALITITNPGHNANNNFYFPLGTFSISPFSSNDNFNSGTLTISGSPTAAPEPATWTMVAAALLAGFVWRAKRLNRTE
jgi:hypothetical protein